MTDQPTPSNAELITSLIEFADEQKLYRKYLRSPDSDCHRRSEEKEKVFRAAAQRLAEAERLRDIVMACEQERQTAQLSGLETGWEHPCTQSAWRKVVAAALRQSGAGEEASGE